MYLNPWKVQFTVLLHSHKSNTVQINNYYYYSVVCLTTGPKPPPKRFLQIVRSKASSFK